MITETDSARELDLTRRQLEIIRRISAELNRFIGLKEKLNNILAILDEQFGIDHSMLFMPDEGHKTLSIYACRGYTSTNTTISFGKGIAGMVAEKRKPISITGLIQKKHYGAFLHKNSEESYSDLPGMPDAGSQIAVPLISNNELVAVLMAESKSSTVFSTEDEDFLLTLATPIAVSIQNSILFDTMEEKIRNRTAELEKLNQTRDKLFSIISHDLRSPLTAFQASAQLIRHYSNQGKSEKMNSLSDKIEQSASKLNLLLDNLLNWSLNQSGSIKCRHEAITLQSFTQEIISLYEGVVTSKNISFNVSISPEDVVIADYNTLSVIFRNIFSNAVKFTPLNGSVTVRTRRNNNTISVSVQDSGPGMDRKKLEGLFSLNSTERTPGEAQLRGTGLGLVLVREFTLLNHGEISVQSIPGRGTKFSVTLPAMAG